MARSRFPALMFAPLLAVVLFSNVKCSEVSHVYALPPTLMIHEPLNASATVQNVHVVKPPEILLRNSLLRNVNGSHFAQLLKGPTLLTPTPHTHIPTSQTPVLPPLPMRRSLSPSPIPVLVPVYRHVPTPVVPQRGSLRHFTRNISPPSPTPKVLINKPASPPAHPQPLQRSPFPVGPTTANFLSSPFPPMNGTSPPFPSSTPFNSFNEVERFINFMPMDYENGQSPVVPLLPHQKRAATVLPKTAAASRRADHGPPQRRNSTSALRNIISSFHEKVSRIFLGPRRRGPKPMRQLVPKPQPQAQQTLQRASRNGLLRQPITVREEPHIFNLHPEIHQTPTNDRSFTSALNTVAQLLQQNQYIPMLGKREKVRTLSNDESQLMDDLRRRDRSRRNRGRHNKRRYPRKRRPHHRPPYEDWPTKHYGDHDEDDYNRQKYQRYPKHYEEDYKAPKKYYGSSFKALQSFKNFKPWKQQYKEEADHEDRYEDRYRGSGRKPVWHIESHETGSFQNSLRPQYYAKTHHHEKHREHSPEFHIEGGADSDGFKPSKPWSFGKFKNWNSGKKVKYHKVYDYDHGVVGSSDNFNTKLKHGASSPSRVKDDDARVPKIIINHHHNLPPASSGTGFTFPSNAVLSYSPPVHQFHDEFYTGSGGGRGGRKKDYRSNENADSFIVNDYGKPPIPGFGFNTQPAGFSGPTAGFNRQTQGFTASSSGFNGPPGAFSAPTSGFNGPPGAFSAPTSGFNAPGGAFNGPAGGFNGHAGGFNGPSGAFNVPAGGFSGPTQGFGPHHSSAQHNGPAPPPPGIGASPQAGGHMIFDHFSQNMPSHFMQAKPPTPNLNHSPFVSGNQGRHPMSYANADFAKSILGGESNGHISPGFSSYEHHHPGPPETFGKPSQIGHFPTDLHENGFPQSTPTEHSYSDEGSAQQFDEPPHFPPSDSVPFSSTNEHQDSPGFIPPFTPVPTPDSPDIHPTQGPSAPVSGESFFSSKRSRAKVPRQFEFKITKPITSAFDIPDKLTNHPLAEKNPNPLRNYFELDIPNREQYKKKRRKNPNINNANNDIVNNHHQHTDEDHDRYNKPATLPLLSNKFRIDSSEFNYSTLPDNWRNFRPDPSHNKLPTFTQDDSKEISSRMHQIRTSFHPKNLVKALINRLPRARLTEKSKKGGSNEYMSGNRGHTKFTPYDAKSREDMSMSPNRKRRKSTKAPASIQDIINSDSSNHNKGVVIPYAGEDDDVDVFTAGDNNNNHNDLYEGGASVPSPVTVVLGKGQAKKSSSSPSTTPKPSSSSAKKQKESHHTHASNEMQTEMPFSNDGGEIDDDTLLGLHTFNVPVGATMRMGEVDDGKKKK